MKILFTIILLLTAFFHRIYAQTALYRGGNLREACRKQVAGHFLLLHNEAESSRSYTTHLKEKIEELEKNRKIYKLKLSDTKKKLAKVKFDMNLIREKEGQENKLLMIEEALKSNKAIYLDHQNKLKTNGQRLKLFSAKLDEIFTVEKVKSTTVKYRFEIDYKNHCPPYRYSCPLPRKDAEKLLALFKPEKTPVICDRYAHFLKW